MNSIKLGTVLFALLAMPAFAAETGSVIKTDGIKVEPFRDAKTIATLSVGDKVEIVKKNGGWLQIKSPKGNGWVHMLNVRKGGVRKDSGVIGGLLGMASGRAGTGKVVGTTGIRGLDEVELQSAKYNETELNLAESYAINRAEAQVFATQGKLVARKFDYLPSPDVSPE
ncbi:MAG: SH3 domain-containing protein [Candidatus Nitrotoga sp.]|nr:SH3 domain-containing protein [Candidatus Nitrotoga sp.]MDO9447221.1 SH3 domain-containing protein [Candidatus Nitrotoga sp.]MDP1636955.1 SH3 domain-containing protein [Candidatus Nitrotoga sp.]MDP1854847.1 SH3 domain-containing protein [Candidatus Nitrotoga sp.]MDP3498079.1 SH3 domain-containing protein [Candidatus Nitrotoga sp.]